MIFLFNDEYVAWLPLDSGQGGRKKGSVSKEMQEQMDKDEAGPSNQSTKQETSSLKEGEHPFYYLPLDTTGAININASFKSIAFLYVN